jgi:hypothetical protein
MTKHHTGRLLRINPRDLDISRSAAFRFRRALPGEAGQSDSDRALIHSISRLGIINPPLVTGNEREPVVVAGFRRLSASIEAGLPFVEVLFSLSGAICAHDHLDVWLDDASFGQPLSDLEKITLASRAADLAGGDLGRISPGLSKIFGREITDDFAGRLLSLTSMGNNVQKFLHEGSLSIGDLLDLSGHAGIDTDMAAEMIGGENLSRSNRRETVRMILHLADQGEDAWNGFIASRGREDTPLRESLEKRCYPNKSRDLASIRKIIQDSGLPPEVSINPPENLEGGAYRVEMKIRDEGKTARAIDSLRDVLESGRFSRLLDILKGR